MRGDGVLVSLADGLARRSHGCLSLAARQLAFEYEIVIVQPGLSKAKLAPAFLDVLGATELFLRETYSMPLAVIASP